MRTYPTVMTRTIGAARRTAAAASGLGLVAACRVSRAVCGTRPDLEHEVIAALRASGLPGDLDPYLTDDVIARIGVDKKRIGGAVRFQLIREVGTCEPAEIQLTELGTILRPAPGA